MPEPPRADPDGYRIPLFDRAVYAARRRRVGDSIAAAGLDGLLVTIPENIYYLTGLDHFGYFAFHMLVFPADGEPVLIARQMETVTVGRDVPDLEFAGYGDDDDLAAHCREVMTRSIGGGKVGVESSSTNLSPLLAAGIAAGWKGDLVDASDLVAELRMIQGREELAVTRRAAIVTDAMMDAAIAAAGEGVTERAVAAAALGAMMAAGGEPPAFWPLVRSSNRLNEDHTTWTDYPLRRGDALFLEMSGSIGRYHAPMGRVVFVGEAPPGADFVAGVSLEAFDTARRRAVPGTEAGQVYDAWQSVLDTAGLSHYRRHHCGYLTGIGFPPTWSGSGVPRGLRAGSPQVLAAGMLFHQMSWVMGTGQGDYFVSDPVVVTPGGGERLSSVSQELRVV
jgi:Xaa-Pro dipeptidase